MVSALGGVTDYSAIGSLNILSGTNQTNEADNSFLDILSDTEVDTSNDITETADKKSDIYNYIKDAMGMPAGVNVEGFDYSQSTDSAAQGTSETNDTSASAGSGGDESQQYDDMDLNKDGVVSAEEVLRYLQMQQQEKLSETLENSLDKYSPDNIMGGLNSKNAASAYQTNSLSGNAMTLNIAV